MSVLARVSMPISQGIRYYRICVYARRTSGSGKQYRLNTQTRRTRSSRLTLENFGLNGCDTTIKESSKKRKAVVAPAKTAVSVPAMTSSLALPFPASPYSRLPRLPPNSRMTQCLRHPSLSIYPPFYTSQSLRIPCRIEAKREGVSLRILLQMRNCMWNPHSSRPPNVPSLTISTSENNPISPQSSDNDSCRACYLSLIRNLWKASSLPPM
jgi:hypothetical protein